MLCVVSIFALANSASGQTDAQWDFKAAFRPGLISAVPGILKSQDRATGRFGSGIWIVTDQNVLFPLAVAWSLPGKDNTYYHSPEVLNAIMAGGDALIDAQDDSGKWVFRKKDNSTWGDIYMPWTYSRWIRAYSIIKDAMPADRKARWVNALTLGYDGISRTALTEVQNIPAHHAMGLYCAGKALDRPEWCTQAATFLRKVAAAQDPAGYWTEHFGPVVLYNTVYVDALGAYYGMSGDKAVAPALERAARFHANFTYPDGSMVETVDERNPYHQTIQMPNAGFTFSPLGRGFVHRQWQLRAAKRQGVAADEAAAFLLYGKVGPTAPTPSELAQSSAVFGDNSARILREKPWFVCTSAYTAPMIESRWIQDRQNFVSLYHDKIGLILGGGNTKLQPLWSTFTVGDVSLLKHKDGDEDPKFTPPPGLIHIPRTATLVKGADRTAGVDLEYGDATCRVTMDVSKPESARVTYSASALLTLPVAAHVTLLPHIGKRWETASGRSGMLGKESIKLGPGEAGAWFSHAGWRASVPAGASIEWPLLPHDPYTKDGHAALTEGRIVMTLPFTRGNLSQTITVNVP